MSSKETGATLTEVLENERLELEMSANGDAMASTLHVNDLPEKASNAADINSIDLNTTINETLGDTQDVETGQVLGDYVICDNVEYTAEDISHLLDSISNYVSQGANLANTCKDLERQLEDKRQHLDVKEQMIDNFRSEIKALEIQADDTRRLRASKFSSAGPDNIVSKAKLPVTVSGQNVDGRPLDDLLNECIEKKITNVATYRGVINGKNEARKQKVRACLTKFLKRWDERKGGKVIDSTMSSALTVPSTVKVSSPIIIPSSDNNVGKEPRNKKRKHETVDFMSLGN